MIGITLKGGKELERKLLALEKKVTKKIVRKAVRAGLKPTHKAAKSNAKSIVGRNMGRLIFKNLVLRAFKKQKRGSYGVTVRIKTESEGAPKEFISETKDGKRYFVPAAIEYGHGLPGEGGKGLKTVPEISFMRKAADQKLGKGEKIFAEETKKGIRAVVKHGS